MKKTAFLLFVAALGFSSCQNNQPASSEAASTEETVTTPVLEAGILSAPDDPVCHMPMETGSIADTASYEGKIYGFCATECKEEFLKEPAKYIAQN